MTDKRNLYVGIVLFLLSLLHSCMQDVFNFPQWLIVAEKMVGSSIFLGIGFHNYFQNPTRRNRNFMPVLLLFWLADLVLPLQFILGGLLFAIAHVLLIVQNLKKVHLKRKHYLIFLFCFILIMGFCLILPVSVSFSLRIFSGMYLSLLLIFLYSAKYTDSTMRLGIILFICSDIILVINRSMGASFLGHLLNLTLYYESVFCFTDTMKKKK